MSLDKAIASGKEHRKPYRGSKAFDGTCRNHGGCGYCSENRLRNKRLVDIRAEEQEQELFNGEVEL